MLALALVASLVAADADAGVAPSWSFSGPAAADHDSRLVGEQGHERLRISSSECDDAGDVGRELAFDGQGYVCAPNGAGGFFWRHAVPAAAASSPPPSSPLSPQLVWIITITVLGFGLTAGGAWLHSTANRTRATNPNAAAAMDALGDELAALKKAVAAGAAVPDLSNVVDSAVESFFHAHTVVTGAPHADDPRAP